MQGHISRSKTPSKRPHKRARRFAFLNRNFLHDTRSRFLGKYYRIRLFNRYPASFYKNSRTQQSQFRTSPIIHTHLHFFLHDRRSSCLWNRALGFPIHASYDQIYPLLLSHRRHRNVGFRLFLHLRPIETGFIISFLLFISSSFFLSSKPHHHIKQIQQTQSMHRRDNRLAFIFLKNFLKNRPLIFHINATRRLIHQ